MTDNRIELLETAPIPKVVLKMALPSIIGLLVMAIYNIVDTMFVAWIGTQATGSTQVVFPIMMAIGAVGLTFGIGGSSVISRLLGEKKLKQAETVVATNFLLAAISGILLLIIGISFIEPIVKLFGATEGMLKLSKDYGIFILFGAPAQVINMTLNNLLRAEGSAKYSMISMMSGAIINIFLDPILIFSFGLGIKGAAIATSFSQFITMFLLISQYLRGRSVLHLNFKNVSLKINMIFEVIKMGSPSFSQQILTSMSMAIINQLSGLYGGESAIAAVGIVSRTMMIVMYVIFGLSQGFQPVAGYNYGSNQINRLKEALIFTLKVSLSIALISCILFITFDNTILGIFKPTELVFSLASSYLKLYAVSIVMMSISTVISAYYQAIGNSFPALLLSIARQGLFLIPLAFMLPLKFGLIGVFLAQPIADFLTLLLTGYFYFKSKSTRTNLIS